MKRLQVSITLFSILLTSSALAQYDFGDKKFEKLYNKLEEYYTDYDYEGILEKEDEILGYVESRQDTLTATIYTFLGESYYIALGER